jgi:hypothetical protein
MGFQALLIDIEGPETFLSRDPITDLFAFLLAIVGKAALFHGDGRNAGEGLALDPFL